MNDPKWVNPNVNPQVEFPKGPQQEAAEYKLREYTTPGWISHPVGQIPPGGIMPIEGDPQKYILQQPEQPRSQLAAALAKAQGEMNSVAFNRVNPHFKSKYADLAAFLDAVRGPLSKNELAHYGVMEMEPTLRWIEILEHSSGESRSSSYPLPANATHHQLGGAITYARRYCLAGLVGIAADDDDDANVATAAQEKITPEQVEHLEILIVETGTDIQKFLGYLAKIAKQDIGKLDDIPASMFPTAFAALDKKHKKEATRP